MLAKVETSSLGSMLVLADAITGGLVTVRKYERHGRATGDLVLQYYRDYQKNRRNRIRAEFFAVYGDTCSICGFSNQAALTLDHVNGDGCVERADPGLRGSLAVYAKAIRDADPTRYRTLCCNCQSIEKFKNGHHLPWSKRPF